MRDKYIQNDVDLIRAILTEIRDRNDMMPREVALKGYDPIMVARHVERLFHDGMIDGFSSQILSNPVADVDVKDLTTGGHALLGALEQEQVWTKLKTALSPSEIASLSIGELAGLARDLAIKAARKKLGLD